MTVSLVQYPRGRPSTWRELGGAPQREENARRDETSQAGKEGIEVFDSGQAGMWFFRACKRMTPQSRLVHTVYTCNVSRVVIGYRAPNGRDRHPPPRVVQERRSGYVCGNEGRIVSSGHGASGTRHVLCRRRRRTFPSPVPVPMSKSPPWYDVLLVVREDVYYGALA